MSQVSDSRVPRKGRAALVLGAGVLAVAALAGTALAGSTVNGPFGFEPISDSAYGVAWDPAQPWIIPDGFTQYVVSDESDLNIYPGGSDDWHDMNTVNETGKDAGRYLYRTHEVRSGAQYGTPPNGAVSVVDLETGKASVIAQDISYDALDGIRWTPWGTVLFAEEITRGRLLEIVLAKNDPMTAAAAVIDRPMLGRIAHEGIEVGPDGSVYVIDEFNGGSIYRFVPDRYGDLSSGQLYALQIQGISDAEQEWAAYDAVANPHTGSFAWVALDMAQVQIDARVAADDVHATEYGRPEDLEMIGQVLYVANTTEDRVLAIDLKKMTITSFVQAGVNVAVENRSLQVTGFNNPDNLASSPNGDLVIIEDNVPSDIWFAAKDGDHDGYADDVFLFASLTDPSAEGTGIYWGKDPDTMFVNIQHSAAPDGDGTWAITKE